MAKVTPEKELEILFPEREFKCSLGTIQVSPFKFGQFPQVVQIANKYVDAFESDNAIQNILAQGSEALDDLAVLVYFSTALSRERLDELLGDEALDLIFKVFEVNADFFIQKIRVGSQKIVERIMKAGA